MIEQEDWIERPDGNKHYRLSEVSAELAEKSKWLSERGYNFPVSDGHSLGSMLARVRTYKSYLESQDDPSLVVVRGDSPAPSGLREAWSFLTSHKSGWRRVAGYVKDQVAGGK